jgi:hypothetical protein
MNTRSEINEELVNRIISAAYGDAGLFEKIKIYFLAARNKEVKKLLNEYKQTASAVNNIQIDKCPDEIIEKIKSDSVNAEDNLLTLIFNFLNQLFHKPMYAAAIVLILVSAAVSLFLFNQKSENQISNQQVAAAEEQVKQSIVFVNRIFERTAGRVENDVLKKQVVRPVHEGISTINNLFKGG